MVDLLLNKQQCETLKTIFTVIDSALQNKIDTAKQKANKYVSALALNEIESLAEYISVETNHEEDKIRPRKETRADIERKGNVIVTRVTS